jgi:hypothetical protein
MPRKRLTFELARFAWGAPDRLELSGRFIGLADGPADVPELVISGANGVHRLPVVPGSLTGPLENGRRWDAVFAWQEPPVAFDVAELQFGSGMVVELPSPDARRSRRQNLAVSRQQPAEEPEPAAQEEEPAAETEGVHQLRAQAELLGTQEALREARETLERTQEELARVRSDLVSEREQRGVDVERFKQALGELRDTAEAALTAEEEATREARAEVVGLQDRVAELEQRGAEAEHLHGELEVARAEAESARAERDHARGALEAAREDLQRVLEQLSGAHHPAGDAA